MTRASTLLLLFVPLASMAQSGGISRLSNRAVDCGPIRISARMDNTSNDLPAVHAQKVRMTLRNQNSTPIVLERVTLHYGGKTPTSGAPFESESRIPVAAGQEAVFAKVTTGPHPVSYVELNFVKYADGSGWKPNSGAMCKIVPDPLRK